MFYFLKKNIFQNRLLYIIILALLSLASFWRILFFDFFQDDVYVLWSVFYNFHGAYGYFKHPGTPLELFTFSHIFGLNVVLWQLFGIGLQVVVAYLTSIFLYKVTNSKLASFLGGIFFAASYLGMYTLNSPLNNVPALTAIPLLLAIIYFINAIKENVKHLRLFVLFLVFAVLLDPARALPVFLTLPFFFLLFSPSKKLIYVKRFFIKFMLAIFIIGIPLAILYFVTFAPNSPLYHFVNVLLSNPGNDIRKLKLMGNFFATVANLFTEIVYGLQPAPPLYQTAYYSRLFGLGGIGLLLFDIISFIAFLRKKSRIFLLISFFITWTFIFYFPNWLAEPHVPMSADNHYLFLSSIGFVCLVAYLISLIRYRWIVIFLSVVFISLNIYKANALLELQFPYRSATVIESMWHTILQTVPKNETNDIFLFSGQELWLDRSFFPWGTFRFLLLSGKSHLSDMPILTTNELFVINKLCASRNPIPLSHVYAWKVKTPGFLENITIQEREKIMEVVQEKNCQILN